MTALPWIVQARIRPPDLEIIDRVYEAAGAHVQARQPNRDTTSDAERQQALRKKIFGVARIVGSGHIDFDTLAEVVIATIPERSIPKRGRSAVPEADSGG